MTSRGIPTALSVALASLLAACSGGSGSSTSPNLQGGGWDTTYSLVVTNLTSTSMVNSYPTRLYSYCNTMTTATGGTTATFRTDTSRARLDKLGLRLVGDVLWLGGDTTTSGNAGARFVTYALLSRASGTGVEGTWDFLWQDTLIPVNVPETDSTLRAARDRRDSSDARKRATGILEQVDISSSTVVIHVKYPDWALSTIADWQNYDSTLYDVTIRRVDANTVTYTAKDGTVVTARSLDRNRTEYSSTNSTKYPTYVAYGDPSSASQCPDNAWLYLFLNAHPKSSSGARSIPSTSPPASKRTASDVFFGG